MATYYNTLNFIILDMDREKIEEAPPGLDENEVMRV